MTLQQLIIKAAARIPYSEVRLHFEMRDILGRDTLRARRWQPRTFAVAVELALRCLRRVTPRVWHNEGQVSLLWTPPRLELVVRGVGGKGGANRPEWRSTVFRVLENNALSKALQSRDEV